MVGGVKQAADQRRRPCLPSARALTTECGVSRTVLLLGTIVFVAGVCATGGPARRAGPLLQQSLTPKPVDPGLQEAKREFEATNVGAQEAEKQVRRDRVCLCCLLEACVCWASARRARRAGI